MPHRHKGGQFLATAISSIANSATAVDGTDFTSKPISVENVKHIALQLEATGDDAAISGDLTAYFAGSPKKVAVWDTANDTSQPFTSLVLTMTTDAVERSSSSVGTDGLAFIKLIAIKNETGKSVSDVNVSFGRSIEVK